MCATPRYNVRTLTKTNAKDFEKPKISQTKSNPHIFWRKFTKGTKSSEPIPTLKSGNVTANTDLEEVEALAKFLSSTFAQEPPGCWDIEQTVTARISREFH